MAFKPLPDVVNVDREEAQQAKPSIAEMERARLLAVKQQLLVTASTPGWQYLKGMAANIVTLMLNEALEAKREDRDDKMADARAAKEIFKRLFTAVEATLTFGTDDEPGWFSNLDDLMATAMASSELPGEQQ
jgi:hypothetical protein